MSDAAMHDPDAVILSERSVRAPWAVVLVAASLALGGGGATAIFRATTAAPECVTKERFEELAERVRDQEKRIGNHDATLATLTERVEAIHAVLERIDQKIDRMVDASHARGR